MQSRLYDVDVAVTADPTDAEGIVDRRGLSLRPDGRVLVEIVGQKGKDPVDPALIERFGGEVRGTWRHLTSAWIPPQRLVELAEVLPAGFFLEAPKHSHPAHEGPGKTGSEEYRDNGANGLNLRIAVFDGGFDSLTEAQGYNAAPASYTAFDFTGTGLENPDDGVHGTGCMETIFDHAPGASYFIYKIDTDDDFGNAVDSAIANGVDVISHSTAWFNQGWADGSGEVNQAVNDATNAGILFFTSAGNYAKRHWRGSWSDPDENDWHEWTAGDAGNGVAVDSGGVINASLQWDTSGGTYDYDFYLSDITGTILDSSESGGNNYETVSWENDTGDTAVVWLWVYRYSGGTTDMQMFVYGSSIIVMEHFVTAGSIASPANSAQDNCVSVGAVDWTDYDSLPGTDGFIEWYSSQGPTNSGNTAPDLCGPTNTSTVAYGGAFGGTSCSTPNAAGTALAFWSSAPSLSADGVRYLLFQKALIFKDWGEPGFDNTFGRGAIFLHAYQANTVWVDRRAGNTVGSASLPYYYVADAQSAATSGGRVVFLGQSYPEAVTLNKNLLWETIGSRAVLGTSAKNLK